MSDAEGQAAATASMDRSAFDHMEKMLREETKGVYTVGHLLGRGGMAVVYLATEVGLSRKVALKVLPPELTFGHGVERFKREARTAAALDHPHIIPIYRISDSGKLFWYAMKFLEGKSLEDLLRERGALSVDESIDILEQVADALDYAHEHKVIHRDIKPANVMLDNRNRVIVTDFGIAKALSEGKLTATDSVIGTPYFMSPEQGMGKTVTGASDQYSVAVMAYRMLAGHVPFDGDSAIDILHKHCMFPPPSLAEAAPHLPAHVVAAVERGLAKQGSERFQSVSDFIAAIKDENFQEKPGARSSLATVVLSPEEAKAMRSGTAGKKPGGSTGPAAKTVAAKPAPAPRPAGAKPAAPAPVPEKKSKAGLIAAAAIVILAGGGFGAWQLTKGGNAQANPAAPTSTQTGAPTNSATPPQTTPANTETPGGPTGNPATVADAGTKATEPPPAPPSAEQKSETKAPNTRPPTQTNRPAGNATRPNNTTTRPPAGTSTEQKAPVQNPVTAPANTPANTPASSTPPATSETGGLGNNGVVRIRPSIPAIVSINLVATTQRSMFVDTLPAGQHLLRVERDGYAPKDTTITLKAGETVTWLPTLQARTP